MIMKYLEKKVEKKSKKNPVEHRPSWVSEKNSSLKAWRYVESLRLEKTLFIKSHSKAADYVKKSNYLIRASEVAKALSIHRTTLMHTSSYSNAFSDFLNAVNQELESKKMERLVKRSRGSARGSIQERKDELVEINKELKRQVANMELLVVRKLVDQSIERLPLPIKKKMGIL